MMVTVGYIIRSIDLVTSYLLLSPVRHHNHLRTGSCCGAVVPGNVTRPHPRSAYVEVSPHLHTTRVTWPHVSSTQTRRGDWKLQTCSGLQNENNRGAWSWFCTAAPSSDHILHPDTWILPWPAVAGQNMLDTAVTRGDHVMMVWALSPHLNIYTSWTLLTSIRYFDII